MTIETSHFSCVRRNNQLIPTIPQWLRDLCTSYHFKHGHYLHVIDIRHSYGFANCACSSFATATTNVSIELTKLPSNLSRPTPPRDKQNCFFFSLFCAQEIQSGASKGLTPYIVEVKRIVDCESQKNIIQTYEWKFRFNEAVSSCFFSKYFFRFTKIQCNFKIEEVE